MLSELSSGVTNTYSRYLDTITPVSKDDVLRRWIFAFCSIHTTWENNVTGYQALQDLEWEGDEHELRRRLTLSGIGLHNHRTDYLTKFVKKFRAKPDYYRVPERNYRAHRDKLAGELLGIGLAKVSFAFEMISPCTPVVCLDRHVLRWMTGSIELNGKMNPAHYRRMERRFRAACTERGLHPVASRHALWDHVQGRPNMRYWSHVFETTPYEWQTAS